MIKKQFLNTLKLTPLIKNQTPIYKITLSQQSLTQPLATLDPELQSLIDQDLQNQQKTLQFHPQESHPFPSTQQCIGSIMNSKYSEGYPGQRYYGGTQQIDNMELLCQKRALKTFNLSEQNWGVNVQGLSVQLANFSVVTGLLKPHDRMFYQGDKQGIENFSKFYDVMGYSSFMRFRKLENKMQVFELYQPKIMVIDASKMRNFEDLQDFKQISEKLGCPLLVQLETGTKFQNQVFEIADIVTVSTNQFMQGNNGCMIFYNLENPLGLKTIIDQTLFPGLQGGPHNHNISGIANTLNQLSTQEYQDFLEESQKNSLLLQVFLSQKGYNLEMQKTGDLVIKLEEKVAQQTQKFLEEIGVYVDRLCGRKLRFSTKMISYRGIKEQDIEKLGALLDKCIKQGNAQELKQEVEQFAQLLTPF